MLSKITYFWGCVGRFRPVRPAGSWQAPEGVQGRCNGKGQGRHFRYQDILRASAPQKGQLGGPCHVTWTMLPCA
jgi:hypothetical protein